MIGADGCCDGTTKWTFQVNDGEWEDWTTANFDKYMNQTETQPPYDPAECHNCYNITSMPLLEAVITVKTVEFSGNAEADFSTLNDTLNRRPGEGYCEIMTWDLGQVYNPYFCGTDAATENVGMYVRVTFPTCFNGTKYSFSLPVDGSAGGISLMDNAT